MQIFLMNYWTIKWSNIIVPSEGITSAVDTGSLFGTGSYGQSELVPAQVFNFIGARFIILEVKDIVIFMQLSHELLDN